MFFIYAHTILLFLVAKCHAAGDPHYTTFDGLYYDFMGLCEYELVTPCTKGSNITWHITGKVTEIPIFKVNILSL